jgi:hypothetical protein
MVCHTNHAVHAVVGASEHRLGAQRLAKQCARLQQQLRADEFLGGDADGGGSENISFYDDSESESESGEPRGEEGGGERGRGRGRGRGSRTTAEDEGKDDKQQEHMSGESGSDRGLQVAGFGRSYSRSVKQADWWMVRPFDRP